MLRLELHTFNLGAAMSSSVVREWKPQCFIPPHLEAKIGGDHSYQKSQKLRQARSEQKVQKAASAINRPADEKVPQFHIYTANNRKSLPGTEINTKKIAKDHDGNNAFNGAKQTVEFYKTVYGRNSIDGHGMDVNSTVHYGRHYANAFWNGQQMVYGDGDHEFLSFTNDLDVIGHEITHGVTDHSAADLVYEGQSGALNESVSDIFGSQIKQYSKNQDVNSADWLVGDFVLKDKPNGAKEALRSMTEKAAYDNAYLGRDTQPKRMGDYHNMPNDEDHDWGGVHDNSGVPNHWFYLLSKNLGEKAVVHSWEQPGHIVYEVLTNGSVKPTATFVDFANATVAAATKLYQKNSAEYNATLKAWKLVEVL